MKASRLRRGLVGTAVALATAVLWLSLGAQLGTQKEVQALIDQVGANAFYIIRGEVERLSEADRALVAGLPGVDEVAGEGVELTHYEPDQLYTLTQLEVSPNYLEAMRLPLAAGRAFAPNEKGVAIIGWEVKETLFRETDPVGQTIVVGGSECQIIGVLSPIPAGDFLRDKFNRLVLVPLGTRSQFLSQFSQEKGDYWALLVRAKDMEEATASARKVFPELEIRPIHQAYSVYFRTEQLLSQTMLASSLGIFLLAGLTMTGLLWVTTLERGWEGGIRRAVGATRGHIFALFVGEGVRLAATAGLAGILVAWALFPVFHRLGRNLVLGPVHGVVFPFALAVGALACLYPAWQTARMSPAQALSLRTLEARRLHGVRVGYLTAALTLSVGIAALFLLLTVTNTAERELRLTWGPLDDQVFLVSAPTKRPILPPPEVSLADARALASIPGVKDVVVLGRATSTVQGNTGHVIATTCGVGAGFADLPLLTIKRGRALRPEELAQGMTVALLSDTLATSVFDDEDPIGKTVQIGGVNFTIVGTFQETLTTLFTMGRVVISYAALAERWLDHSFWVRTTPQADVAKVEQSVVAEFQDLYPGKAKVEIINPARERAKEMQSIQLFLGQLGLVSGASLVTGAASVFNLISLLLFLRTREMGIRRAVGAGSWHILGLGMGEALKIAILAGTMGLGLGIGGMWLLVQFRVFPVGRLDPMTLGVTMATACGLGILAGGWPAWRVSRLPPAEALRRGKG